jgi:hypothetical protein
MRSIDPKIQKFLHDARLESSAQLYQLYPFHIPNRSRVKNPGTTSLFESSMNFKGVQTFWGKSDKFSKNPLDLIFTKVNLVGHTSM